MTVIMTLMKMVTGVMMRKFPEIEMEKLKNSHMVLLSLATLGGHLLFKLLKIENDSRCEVEIVLTE